MPPPQRSTSTNPIPFKDFSPGIADNPGINYGAETATAANTYRCIANRAGALVPLPYRFNPIPFPLDEPSPVEGHLAVIGLYLPPIGVVSTTSPNQDLNPTHELHMGTEWLAEGQRHMRWRRIRRFEGTGGVDEILKSVNRTDAATHYIPLGMGWATTRSNRAAPTTAGHPIVVASYGDPSGGFLSSFPDDQNLTSNTPYDAFTNPFILNIACHQGRTVAEFASSDGRGVNAITFTGENLHWSKVNTFGDWTPNTDPAVAIHAFPQVFVEENPSGYGFLAPMSANELFMVKIRGGLYVSGDLDNPNVVSLPMVVGTETSQRAAVTEIGVVYGNATSGIWVWPHGDTSQLLSPKMNPEFWLVGGLLSDMLQGNIWGGVHYALDRCDEWVLVPNNWIFDTIVKSWWRLEDPAITQIRYFTAMSRFIYGSPGFYTNDTAQTHALHFWRRDVKATSYSWQSQPIWQSVADIVNVDTVELITEGQGTVTLTLTALNGDNRTIVITLANCGFPERFREAFAMQGTYLQLRVQVDSMSIAPAPTVYSVTLYPYSEQPIGHTL